MDWKDVMPVTKARSQEWDERRRGIARAIEAGASMGEIARILRITPERVRAIYHQVQRFQERRHHRSPVEFYFEEIDDLRKMARKTYKTHGYENKLKAAISSGRQDLERAARNDWRKIGVGPHG